MAQTKQVVLTTTVLAATAWQPSRFVNYAGAQASAGDAVLGVSAYAADQGDMAAVDVVGIAIVEAAGAIASGDSVAADAQGLAIKLGGSGIAAGRALDAASSAGETIRILLGA
ncbi:capsid cement protein [Snodgrassella sp. CFCC 13594]|uniref:capsid cement protein n=1 Tax=Snodgrassella sp. CFCC 13594 TaxID=1775559 RepID=UPI000829CAF4|nr:capsid cement protein [Snodgrassella sp. CFCC 13594]